METQFSKYDKFFITDEIQHDEMPYKFKKIIMLECGGIFKDIPIYSIYTITIMTYIDGYQLITNSKMGFEINEDSSLLSYYKENYHELDKSFKSTFKIMYSNVDVINDMTNTIKKQINNI